MILSALIAILLVSSTRLPSEAQQQLQDPAASQWRAANVHYLLVNSSSETNTTTTTSSSQVARRLSQVLELVGPDMRPASGFNDSLDVDLELAQFAWRQMRQHALVAVGERVKFAWPTIERTLSEANVSGECLVAAQRTARAAQQLNTWAIQLLNSWASFPAAGLFEGTLGDVGSFHGCLNVEPNEDIRHAHYCALSYRPVLPVRRDYELVVSSEPSEMLDLFPPGDAFNRLLKKAQYNHYVYFKIGTCFPIDCSPQDVQQFARLLGRRATLMSGPVKCHSKFEHDYEQLNLSMSFKDVNAGVYIWKPHMTGSQRVALLCLIGLLVIILGFTLADLIINRMAASELARVDMPAKITIAQELQDPNNNNSQSNGTTQILLELTTSENKAKIKTTVEPPLWRQLVRDCSLITSTRDFFHISEQQLRSDILCMNGLRCITMSWIILAHTIQYNDWSAFARIYDVESQLKSWLNQPLFNASYLVDTFFLMSGLLTSYSIFKRSKDNLQATMNLRDLWTKFSCKSYIIGRYLRLTPQIWLVSLLFIVLPLTSSSSGPHWMAMTGEYSENCANNWWINLLHLQAFYKSDEMCNFVCWWISVDMLYHLLALALIAIVLRAGNGRTLAYLCATLATSNALLQATRHFQLELPPNLLSTIPQTGAMWTSMTLEYFWTPVAHVFPFALGLQLGYLMAARATLITQWLTRRRSLVCWSLTFAGYSSVLFATHAWVLGESRWTRFSSTSFALTSQAVWSSSVAYTIVACHLNRGGPISALLSCRLFIILGRASYLVYLSHFLVLFTFFGSQNLLLEPTRIMIIYIIIGNVCLSMLLGSALCVALELPWLKIQKRIMRHVK